MKLELDTIQFESRQEIASIIAALEEWQENGGHDPAVDELIKKLDVMMMCW